MVNVVVRDIDNVGPVLDGAVAAGANTVYGVNFYLEDSPTATSQARALAVQDAAEARPGARRSRRHDARPGGFDHRGLQLRPDLRQGRRRDGRRFRRAGSHSGWHHHHRSRRHGGLPAHLIAHSGNSGDGEFHRCQNN